MTTTLTTAAPATAAPVTTAPVTTAPGAGGSPRVLIAPVTVTPTKPLSPSHLKGLLWTDVMVRATGCLAPATYRYSLTTYAVTEQTMGFWAYLDREAGDVDWTGASEAEIGSHYVRFRAEQGRPEPAELLPYAHAVERTGWRHPASERIVRHWKAQYERLGLCDPGLEEHQPPGFSLEELLAWLCARDLSLDQRTLGGPVFVDATRHGLPLRQIVDAAGRANYLACALRELVPLAAGHDEIVFVFDPGLEPDHVLLERVLESTGVTVRRVPVGRVPIDGTISSSRSGAWKGNSAGELLTTLAGEPDDVVRLGARLYFVALLGPGQSESFRPDLLLGSMRRAERILARAESAPERAQELLARHRGRHGYVDPYRLTSGLLGKRRPPAPAELLREVYACAL